MTLHGGFKEVIVFGTWETKSIGGLEVIIFFMKDFLQ